MKTSRINDRFESFGRFQIRHRVAFLVVLLVFTVIGCLGERTPYIKRLLEITRRIKMTKTTLKIDGMMCSMCEVHICDTIRKAEPSARKVSASRGKGEASFLTEEPVDAESLRAAVNATGYACLEVSSEPYEKKGWLFRK